LTTPSVWAVVVARTGPTAKSRLAPVLDVHQRERLAEAMLADVVSACVSAGLAGPVVVTDAPAARERFASRGFPSPADAGTDMNGAARAGIAAAAAAGAGAVPLASPADLITLTSWASRGATVVGVAADRSGRGTNALLLRPPGAIRPGFGPHSAERHRALARRAGATVVVDRPPTLAFDVDTPADLTLLRRLRPGGETGALLEFLATAGAGAPGA
jgi:2-phospho-L-lactate guanylyltransferase